MRRGRSWDDKIEREEGEGWHEQRCLSAVLPTPIEFDLRQEKNIAQSVLVS